MTLVVLAAGMGSRYGGMKQIDPITKHGNFIIDFSVYDAIKAGFDRVVFIIKPENEKDFEETIGARLRGKIKVEYAYQTLDNLPEGFTVPEGRVKPWGTSHALLCAKDVVGNDKFAVINADDFYGREMYEKIAEFLRNLKDGEENKFCMVGYVLNNTLSPNGTVTRGLCQTNDEGKLVSLVETFKIQPNTNIPEGAESFENGEWVPLDKNSIVSMNCWGMTSAIFSELEADVVKTLSNPDRDPLKCEALLPTAVFNMISEGKCTVDMLTSNAHWYGVTVREDKPTVAAGINELIEAGVYPENLWA